jgi:3-phenylpropionate/trans-cinnamate dioxygenase ferredoxin reductase subunit
MGQMFAVVTFRRSRHVADPCDFTNEELPGYWADVRTVAKTIERAYVDNGIWVDAQLRSSVPDIYAAGDVANAFHPLLGKHIRVEHWANALHQPQAAAKAMLGQDVAYDRVPYFFTDQYDLGMEYSGYVEPGAYDEVVFRGDVARREFIAFWLGAHGRVLAA